jgi:hypothetical protein
MGRASVFCVMRLRFTFPEALLLTHRPTPKNMFVSIGRRMSTNFSAACGRALTEAPPPSPPGYHAFTAYF